MVFTPKISLTDTDIREDESISFVESTLKGHGVKTQISKGDKGANVDGFIELLDSENRLTGKVTVQVKTVSPSKEGMFEFACPTSLFAYAERTTEVVFLLAVDHKNQVALWKHISRELIDANRSKEGQDTITLHFSPDERLSPANVDAVVDKWRLIANNQIKRFVASPYYQKELNELKEYILRCQSLPLDLCPERIAVLQSFIDDYNKLLLGELSYFKNKFYPNVWKFGVAFSEFSDTRLSYTVFPINKGEQLAEIRRLPHNVLWSMRTLSIHGHNVTNPFVVNYRQVIKEQVKQHVDLFLKNMEKPELSPFAMETIMSSFRKDSDCRVFQKQDRLSFSKLTEWIERNFPDVSTTNIHLFDRLSEYPLTDIYKALQLLISSGVDNLVEPYEPKGSYGSTGYIYDWYNADTAFTKMMYVVENVNNAFEKFVSDNFPAFSDYLLNRLKCDVIIYNLRYNSPDGRVPGIDTYYLNTDSHVENKTVIYSKNGDSDLYQEINKSNYPDLFRKGITYQGIHYKVMYWESSIAHEILFSDAPLWDTYSKLMKDRFEHLHEII